MTSMRATHTRRHLWSADKKEFPICLPCYYFVYPLVPRGSPTKANSRCVTTFPYNRPKRPPCQSLRFKNYAGRVSLPRKQTCLYAVVGFSSHPQKQPIAYFTILYYHILSCADTWHVPYGSSTTCKPCTSFRTASSVAKLRIRQIHPDYRVVSDQQRARIACCQSRRTWLGGEECPP